jgi:hypothetical protein
MSLGVQLFWCMYVISFSILLGPCFSIFAFTFHSLSTKKCVYMGIALDLLATTIIAISVVACRA